MLRSMTGFGDASAENHGIQYYVEIRSLNNKFYKSTIRLPDAIQGLEPEIDSILRNRLIRGSITVTVKYSDTTEMAAHDININALQHYIDKLGELPHDEGHPVTIDPATLIVLPGVLLPPTDIDKRVDRVRPTIINLINKACDSVMEMRHCEGKMLHTDLHKHRESIDSRLAVIAQRIPTVVEEYYQRLKLRVETMLKDAEVKYDQVDLIREVAVFAERSDISEELTRLSAHLTQFRDMIDSQAVEPIGRTLDFLAQELLREANTIASKSNDSEISREIVEIKGAIDRIKEQVQNVE